MPKRTPLKRPPDEHGFDWKEFRKLPPDKQEELKRAVAEEYRSEEKHKKRAQRSAECELNSSLRGSKTRVEPVNPGPDRFCEKILFVKPEDDFRTALDLDLYDALAARLPLRLHRLAAARTLLPEHTIADIATMLHIDYEEAKKGLMEVRRILREKGSRDLKRSRVVELNSEGKSIREIGRLTDLPPSTVHRWICGKN